MMVTQRALVRWYSHPRASAKRSMLTKLSIWTCMMVKKSDGSRTLHQAGELLYINRWMVPRKKNSSPMGGITTKMMKLKRSIQLDDSIIWSIKLSDESWAGRKSLHHCGTFSKPLKKSPICSASGVRATSVNNATAHSRGFFEGRILQSEIMSSPRHLSNRRGGRTNMRMALKNWRISNPPKSRDRLVVEKATSNCPEKPINRTIITCVVVENCRVI